MAIIKPNAHRWNGLMGFVIVLLKIYTL